MGQIALIHRAEHFRAADGGAVAEVGSVPRGIAIAVHGFHGIRQGRGRSLGQLLIIEHDFRRGGHAGFIQRHILAAFIIQHIAVPEIHGVGFHQIVPHLTLGCLPGSHFLAVPGTIVNRHQPFRDGGRGGLGGGGYMAEGEGNLRGGGHAVFIHGYIIGSFALQVNLGIAIGRGHIPIHFHPVGRVFKAGGLGAVEGLAVSAHIIHAHKGHLGRGMAGGIGVGKGHFGGIRAVFIHPDVHHLRAGQGVIRIQALGVGGNIGCTGGAGNLLRSPDFLAVAQIPHRHLHRRHLIIEHHVILAQAVFGEGDHLHRVIHQFIHAHGQVDGIGGHLVFTGIAGEGGRRRDGHVALLGIIPHRQLHRIRAGGNHPIQEHHFAGRSHAVFIHIHGHLPLAGQLQPQHFRVNGGRNQRGLPHGAGSHRAFSHGRAVPGVEIRHRHGHHLRGIRGGLGRFGGENRQGLGLIFIIEHHRVLIRHAVFHGNHHRGGLQQHEIGFRILGIGRDDILALHQLLIGILGHDFPIVGPVPHAHLGHVILVIRAGRGFCGRFGGRFRGCFGRRFRGGFRRRFRGRIGLGGLIIEVHRRRHGHAAGHIHQHGLIPQQLIAVKGQRHHGIGAIAEEEGLRIRQGVTRQIQIPHRHLSLKGHLGGRGGLGGGFRGDFSRNLSRNFGGDFGGRLGGQGLITEGHQRFGRALRRDDHHPGFIPDQLIAVDMQGGHRMRALAQLQQLILGQGQIVFIHEPHRHLYGYRRGLLGLLIPENHFRGGGHAPLHGNGLAHGAVQLIAFLQVLRPGEHFVHAVGQVLIGIGGHGLAIRRLILHRHHRFLDRKLLGRIGQGREGGYIQVDQGGIQAIRSHARHGHRLGIGQAGAGVQHRGQQLTVQIKGINAGQVHRLQRQPIQRRIRGQKHPEAILKAFISHPRGLGRLHRALGVRPLQGKGKGLLRRLGKRAHRQHRKYHHACRQQRQGPLPLLQPFRHLSDASFGFHPWVHGLFQLYYKTLKLSIAPP